jgi:hypothetical protein
MRTDSRIARKKDHGNQRGTTYVLAERPGKNSLESEREAK